MNNKELVDWCRDSLIDKPYLDFPEDVLDSVDINQAEFLIDYFMGRLFMRLPGREILFFSWLRKNDPGVWDDLWGNTDEEPYLVSLIFLKILIDKTRGFPICDLIRQDNYYFTKEMAHTAEAKDFFESVTKRFMAKESLSPAQLLALEISIAPIDIWHFAYRHKLELSVAKEALQTLIDDDILIHLKSAEHLANFVDL